MVSHRRYCVYYRVKDQDGVSLKQIRHILESDLLREIKEAFENTENLLSQRMVTITCEDERNVLEDEKLW